MTLGESDLGKVVMGQGEVLTLLLAEVNMIRNNIVKKEEDISYYWYPVL